ncbi:ATP-binding protein [Maridesulfovibrio sp. FT414]|uniref:ATP-binding protein n=1 Tax=Maridesulfovibrio sp. FT414 TaxID=2979469 RepID=UPI003D801721
MGWRLISSVKEELARLSEFGFSQTFGTNGGGIKHFSKEDSGVCSPINTAATIYYSKEYLGGADSFLRESPTACYQKYVTPELEQKLVCLDCDLPEKTVFEAYYVSQLALAANGDVATETLASWLDKYITDWLLGRRSYSLSMYVVYLASRVIERDGNDLQELLNRLSLFVVTHQISLAKAQIWEEFDSLELVFSLSVLKNSNHASSIVPLAINVLREVTERQSIWKSQNFVVNGKRMICSSAYNACVALLLSDIGKVYFDELISCFNKHFEWITKQKYSNSWLVSDSSLRERIVEPWFNLIVLEFLNLFSRMLEVGLQDSLKEKYQSKIVQSKFEWDDMMLETIDKDAIKNKVIEPLRSGVMKSSAVILYGPPGTAKTTIVETLSKSIGWPFIELTVSDFLSGGLDSVYANANTIFGDLQKIEKVVVLLDEVEHIFADRDSDSPDLRKQFLTGALLPPLKKIHDEKKILLCIATNHIDIFDAAISRPGRIDMIIPVGPPNEESKTNFFIKNKGLEESEARDLAKLVAPETTIGELLLFSEVDFSIDGTNKLLKIHEEWKSLLPNKMQISSAQYKTFLSDIEEYRRV